MDGNLTNLGITLGTLIFSVGVQFGMYKSVQKSFKDKFAELNTKIMSLEQGLDKKEEELGVIRKDMHRSDLILTEIKVMVQNIAASVDKMERNTKESIEKLHERINANA